MSSFKNSTNTPLDCFASAMKLVIQAVTINIDIVPLAKEISVSFASVAKDPSSVIPVLSRSKTGSNEGEEKSLVDCRNTNSSDCIMFLVEAIRILSLSSPMFPNEVSRLIPLIISHMSCSVQSTGFPLAKAGGETSAENLETREDVSFTKKISCTVIESFVHVIELVIEAAMMNTEVSPLVPKIMECFSSIARDPNARKKQPFLPFFVISSRNSMKTVESNTAVPNNMAYGNSSLLYLIEAIRILSVASPTFPTEISRLYPSCHSSYV